METFLSKSLAAGLARVKLLHKLVDGVKWRAVQGSPAGH